MNDIALFCAEVGAKTLEQIYLVALSITIAMFIAVPLGIVLQVYKRWQGPILSITNGIQTIPSLALFGMLLPLLGIGTLPAIVALTLYSLLPILRNTLVGLDTIPKATLQAAKSLGLSRPQQLWQVELPLALPTMITGIRIATVLCIGIGTLAAFIGAGGLGDFINQGLSTNNTHLILKGAIPAALLALSLDFALGGLQRYVTFRRSNLHVFKQTITLFSLIFFALLTTQVVQSFKYLTSQPTLTIASKNFTESMVLAELMAQSIERNTDLTVKRKLRLGTTAIVHNVMLKGEVDLYPEYTGTAWLVILKKPYTPGLPANTLYDTLIKTYETQFGLTWLPPFGFENSQTLAVKKSFAKQFSLKNMSDLVRIQDKLVAGVPPEFTQRADALPGLMKHYNLHLSNLVELDSGLMYQAIKNDRVNLINPNSTDGRLLETNLVVLEDDKAFYPPYDAAAVIRLKTLEKYPGIKPALAALFGSLNEETIRELNYQIDVKKRSVQTVVAEYLAVGA